MIAFIVGLVCGAFFGVSLMALLVCATRSEEMEQKVTEREKRELLAWNQMNQW